MGWNIADKYLGFIYKYKLQIFDLRLMPKVCGQY